MSVSPTRPKGPPLNALRAFEAAARHNSFLLAADELSVTPGAISQHIKTLEHWTGVSLFHRHAKGVELTPAARSLVSDFSQAFDALAEATHGLRALRPAVDIHIAALPAVAQLWLPARLSRIRQAFPGLNISVTAVETAPNLRRELFDICLFFSVPTGDADEQVLSQDSLTPVCSPHLAREVDGNTAYQDVTLLHDQAWKDDWSIWLASAGVSGVDPHQGPKHSLYSLAVEEAKSSAGLLIGHECLLEKSLKDGSLVRLSDHRVLRAEALVMTLPMRSLRRAEVDEVALSLSR
ncbi:MAG: LysR family transcriptional regulator [Pseudomonadota bacterium]